MQTPWGALPSPGKRSGKAKDFRQRQYCQRDFGKDFPSQGKAKTFWRCRYRRWFMDTKKAFMNLMKAFIFTCKFYIWLNF